MTDDTDSSDDDSTTLPDDKQAGKAVLFPCGPTLIFHCLRRDHFTSQRKGVHFSSRQSTEVSGLAINPKTPNTFP